MKFSSYIKCVNNASLIDLLWRIKRDSIWKCLLQCLAHNHQSIVEIIVIVKISSWKLPWQFISGSMSYIPGWELRFCVPQDIAKKVFLKIKVQLIWRIWRNKQTSALFKKNLSLFFFIWESDIKELGYLKKLTYSKIWKAVFISRKIIRFIKVLKRP